MISIIHGARAGGTNMLVDNMHQDRKRIFVDRVKWDVPVLAGEFEVDQFDTDAAVYLIAVSAAGEHRGDRRDPARAE